MPTSGSPGRASRSAASEPRAQRLSTAKSVALEEARHLACALSVTPPEAARRGLTLNQDGQRRTAMDLLSYPTIGFGDVTRIWPQLGQIAPAVAQQIEIDAKYSVYLDRQAADVAAYRRDEGLELPEDFDYAPNDWHFQWKCDRSSKSIRPRTIGQAGRIDGITPAALTLLVAHMRRGRPNGARAAGS